MPIKKIITKGKVPVKIYTENIELSAYEQLANIAELPIIYPHIAAMPDVHCGIGATVGSVIPTRQAIIPAAVGVDIGCGMHALRLSLQADQLPDNLHRIRSAIEAAVPVGFNLHKKDAAKRSTITALMGGLEHILAHNPKLTTGKRSPYKTWIRQLGTLGGGNHFIEICLDEQQQVWIMLHSGSRGIGNRIGQYFIAQAKRDMENQLGRLPHKDLAYFTEGTQHFEQYVHAVHWAQQYAQVNRQEMMRHILAVLKREFPHFNATKEAINCHHNYVAVEQHFGATLYVTRKGAIRAGIDELGIIPGSMGTKSYIVKGKGNPMSFSSCSHGAGRKMSRTAAKKRFNQADLAQQTEGIECRKDKAVIDEIPAAYKDIDQVMEDQNDLVDIVHTLKQVVCIKG